MSVAKKTDVQRAAALLGRKGGKASTARKAATAAANGKKGGRPRTPAGGVYLQSDRRYWLIAYYRDGVRHRESTGTTDRRVAEQMLRERLRGAR